MPPDRSGPSRAVIVLTSAALIAIWGALRLAVFSTFIFPLTYALPLLSGIWSRSRRAVWTMAVAFAVLQSVHQLWILPADALDPSQDLASLGATFVNIFVAAIVVHLVINLRERLEASLQQVRAQGDELQAQADELQRQNEELSQQTEELSQQNEELQHQASEIQVLSDEATARQSLLQGILHMASVAGSEQEALRQILGAGLEMFPRAAALVVYEARGDQLVVLAAGGSRAAAIVGRTMPVAGTFAGIVLGERRVASLPDVARRADLRVPELVDAPCASVLCAPATIGGAMNLAIALCKAEPYEWTDQEFRLAEWLARQCAQTIDVLRLYDELRRQVALIHLSPDAIIVRRPDGIVTFWSRGAESLYGWTKEEACGRMLHDILQTEFPEPLDEIEAALEKTGHWSGELKHRAKDGCEIFVESRWQLQGAQDGREPFVLVSNMDITDRHRAEEMLREADQRKSEFLATLSHELRNPLAPMQYAVEVLNHRGDPETARPRAIIERQLRHLVALVDDLLDITRIVNNKIQLRKARVDAVGIVSHVVEAARPQIATAGHECTLEMGPDRLWIDADAERVAQIVSNLVTNAIRYTPAPGRIRVAADRQGDRVRIAVRDSGIGLRGQDLGRVFEMFTQVGTGGGGLGIGLSLVKRLVEMHGGSIEARSDGPGRGSEFIVLLPWSESVVEAAQEEVVEEPEEAAARRVLIVDDNTDSADMLKTFLELDGHIAMTAHDGERALKIAAEFKPEVALLDVGLPGMSGYELSRRLRGLEETRDVFLVAVTGWGSDADRQRAREAGFDAHLTKPPDPDRLSRLVRRARRVDAM